jgi:outer membrane protein OmpA-like peptidoglycan-associated protein
MKTTAQFAPYLFGAVLAGALMTALPAAAQDVTKPTPTTPATAQDTVVPAAKPEMATGKDPLTIEKREGFWGRVNPFARKKWVQREVSPVKDRVNELDELTAANSKMIKDVDARAQAGIQQASQQATMADQHALDAQRKADAAAMAAKQADQHLASVEQQIGNLDQYKPVAQTEIRFRPGQITLSKAAKDALDEMATPLAKQRGYVIEVQGFSTGKGQTAIASSQKMAEAVVRYLVLNHEIPVYRIFMVGMGNAPKPAEADGPNHRAAARVEISLLRSAQEAGLAQASANVAK